VAELLDAVRGILIGEGFAARADVVAARIVQAVDEQPPTVLPATAIRFFPPGDGGGITVEWRDLPPIDNTVAVLDRLTKLAGEVHWAEAGDETKDGDHVV